MKQATIPLLGMWFPTSSYFSFQFNFYFADACEINQETLYGCSSFFHKSSHQSTISYQFIVSIKKIILGCFDSKVTATKMLKRYRRHQHTDVTWSIYSLKFYGGNEVRSIYSSECVHIHITICQLLWLVAQRTATWSRFCCSVPFIELQPRVLYPACQKNTQVSTNHWKL